MELFGTLFKLQGYFGLKSTNLMPLLLAILFALLFFYFTYKDKRQRLQKNDELDKKARDKEKRDAEKASRKLKFEKQLKEYSQNVSQHLLNAIENQVYSEDLDVTFKDVVIAFSSGDKNEISKVSSRILRASDESLKELAKHFDAFRGLVANLPKESLYLRDYRQTSLGAANLLGEINRGHCRCRTFNDFNNFLPSSAEERGDIKILEKTSDKETYSSCYYYQCSRCGATAEAHVNWSGHGPFTTIKRYNSKP